MNQTKLKTLKMAILAGGMVLPLCGFGSVYASGAVTAINNLNRLVFDIIAAIGVLVCIVGLIFLIASIPSHDTSQRIGGAIGFAAGLLLYFLEDVLGFIGISISGSSGGSTAGAFAAIEPVVVELCSKATDCISTLL